MCPKANRWCLGQHPKHELVYTAPLLVFCGHWVPVIKNLVKTRLPTGFGDFSLYLYLDGGKEHLALVKGDVAECDVVPVRVHSECLTGDVFASRRCDCGDQLKHTLMYLGRQKAGILIYLRQEGRGIGLLKKMEAYNLQDQGLDTVEANIQLGHQADERDYGIAARILRSLGVTAIRLITNNPHKVEELESNGINVLSRIPIEVGHHEENLGYLKSKAERMAHLLRFSERVPEDQDFSFLQSLKDQLVLVSHASHVRPFVTLAYAQSMDGTPLLRQGGVEERISDSALMRYLRSLHAATLYSAKTLKGDADLLAAAAGSALSVVWDPALEWGEGGIPWVDGIERLMVVTGPDHDRSRLSSLLAQGVRVLVLAESSGEYGPLGALLEALGREGVRTLLVQGDDVLVGAFLFGRCTDYCVITMVPCFVGGSTSLSDGARVLPQIAECAFETLGSDVIAFGPLHYGSGSEPL